MASKVYVVGVGMTKFEKPGAREWDYPDMARESGTKALEDAGIDYREVQQAYVGYVYGESTSGQRAVYELGMTGIPVVMPRTTTAPRARRRCSWPPKPSAAAAWTARWRWASRRCSRVLWAPPTTTANSR